MAAAAATPRSAKRRPEPHRRLPIGATEGGDNLVPVFPYPSITKITDDDVRAIRAYLASLPAVRHANQPHDVAFPFSWRFLQSGWKLLFFTPGPFAPTAGQSEAYNRGAY